MASLSGSAAAARRRLQTLAGHLVPRSCATAAAASPSAEQPLQERVAGVGLSVKPLTPKLGAVVAGVDLSQDPLPTELKEALTKLFLEYKVLFFRDQKGVDSGRQVRLVAELSAYWGIAQPGQLSPQQEVSCKDGIFVHPFLPNRGQGQENIWPVSMTGYDTTSEHNKAVLFTYESVLDANNPMTSRGTWQRQSSDYAMAAAANVFHADNTFLQEPSSFTVLRAGKIPEVGGDTIFADMSQAYDDLDEQTKQGLEGRKTVHGWEAVWPGERQQAANTGDWSRFRMLERNYPLAIHPVFRTHPVTGRKVVYVNRTFTDRFVPREGEEGDERKAEEDREMLERLLRLPHVPEYCCRFRWENVGDMAMWDNRVLVHYAVRDYEGSTRSMDHTASLGEKPF